jgi:RimJ/RimL family protein N-acetyltransferase
MLPALTGPRGPMHAVVAFAGHHVIATDVDESTACTRLPRDDLGAPMSASFLLFLAGWVGAEPGTLDVVLAAPPSLSAPSRAHASDMDVWVRDDLDDHPRVRRARHFRPDAVVYADAKADEPAGVLLVGQGVAGRWEMAYEVEPAARGRGLGRRLAGVATSLVPEGEPVFAQVAPGNVSSMRACLAAGYVPVGAEVLFAPR